MNRSDILKEISEKFSLEIESGIVDFFGLMSAYRDILTTLGEIDGDKLQNAKLLHRIKLVEKFGYPEYSIILPNQEIQINKYDQ